jgi:hypothetical protein
VDGDRRRGRYRLQYGRAARQPCPNTHQTVDSPADRPYRRGGRWLAHRPPASIALIVPVPFLLLCYSPFSVTHTATLRLRLSICLWP